MGTLVGYSLETNRNESLEGFRDKLPGNDLTVIDAGSPEGQTTNGTASEWAIQSVFGRLKYDFDDKYLFESTLRYDGSSRFPPQRKYGLFPSVGVAWRVSAEDFFP